MYELPLFPLNTVLFPGMPLKLHIFEDRYKKMIARCRQNGTPFGVVLIQAGDEVGFSAATPYSIGCTAQITQVEPLAQGRMNIVAIGVERFEIKSLLHNQPYLVGMVENFPLQDDTAPEFILAGRRLRPWVKRYLEVLAQANNSEFDMGQLPFSPEKLSNLASFLLQIPASQKQDLLSLSDASQYASDLCTLYRREVTLLNIMLSEGPLDSEIGIFSNS